MTTIAPDVRPPTAIRGQLARLRRRLYVRVALSALGRLGIALVAWVALSLLLDWRLRWDRDQRLILLLLAVATALALGYRWLVRPWRRRLDDQALCLRVEAAHPSLGQRMVAALQLASPRPRPRNGAVAAQGSPDLVAHVIRQGEAAARAVDVAGVLSPRFRRRAALHAVTGAALALLLAAAFAWPASGGVMRLWLNRNVLLGERQWTHRTHLTLLNGHGNEIVLPRGSDWRLRVRAAGVVPAGVWLDVQPLTDGEEHTLALTRVDAAHFEGRLHNLLASMRVRARGGDAISPWLTLRVVDRPAVRKLRLVAHPPAYTGQRPKTLDVGQTTIPLLAGSTLDIALETNKPIQHAGLQYDGKMVAVLQPAGRDARSASAAAADHWHATLSAAQLHTGRYTLALSDRWGLAAEPAPHLSVRVTPDQPPKVHAALQGISGWVTPDAVVPIRYRIEDDFGLTTAAVTWQTPNESPPPPRVGAAPGSVAATQPIDGRIALWKKSNTAAAAISAIRHPPSAMPKLADTYRLDLRQLHPPVGAELSLYVQARDNDAIHGPKLGRSTELALKVVSPDEMRQELLRREQEQRRNFARLLDEQQRLRDGLRELQLATKDKPSLSDAQRAKLDDARRRQHMVAQRSRGIADAFSQILAQTMNNRLAASTRDQHRIADRIVAPLRDLAAHEVPRAVGAIAAAAQPTAPAADRARALAHAIDRQAAMAGKMATLLHYMQRREGYQQAVKLLQDILDNQAGVHDATVQQRRQRIDSIFEESK